jgi:hypothetical protein
MPYLEQFIYVKNRVLSTYTWKGTNAVGLLQPAHSGWLGATRKVADAITALRAAVTHAAADPLERYFHSCIKGSNVHN